MKRFAYLLANACSLALVAMMFGAALADSNGYNEVLLIVTPLTIVLLAVANTLVKVLVD